MKYLVYIATFLLVSCGSGRKPSETTSEKQIDSVTVTREFIPVEKTVTIPADSIELSIPFAAISEVPLVRTSPTGRTRLQVYRKADMLHADCTTEELERTVTFLSERITELTRQVANYQKTITVPKRYVPNFFKNLALVGGSFIILILIISIVNLIKYIKT